MVEGQETQAPLEGQTGDPVAPEPAASAPPTSAQAPGPDPFHGVSREEVIRRYRGLEDQHNRTTAERQQLGEFFGRVKMFFQSDGNDGVELNNDMIMQHLRAKGLIPVEGEKPASPANQNQNTPPSGEEDFMDRFTENPQKSLRDVIREELQGFQKETLQPLQQTVMQDRHEAWINQVVDRHPEFPQWRSKVAEFVKNHNWPVNSVQDLEKAFLHAKLDHGDYIPKAEHDTHVSELNRTLQLLNPGASMGDPQIADTEMSPEQLIGVKPPSNEDGGAVSALFGKSALPPYPRRSRS